MVEKGRIKELFGRSATHYVKSETHSKGADLARLIEMVAPSARGRVLDVATGGGHVALSLAPIAGLTVASDLTLGMLKEARRFISEQGWPGVLFCAADAETLPFSNGAFTAVTCRIALHHVQALESAFSEFYRVLAPGGCLGFQDSMVPEDSRLGDFLNRVERLRDPTHVRSRTRHEWSRLIEGAGFRLEGAEVFKKEHDFPAWAGRSSSLDEAGRVSLERAFLEAPEAAADYFKIHVERGRLVSYTDDKLIILARKD